MGYDISVKFKTDAEREVMKDFLLSNKQILDKMEVLEYGQFLGNNEPTDGENLGYTPKKKYLLGFHSIVTPKYLWDLCAWMAVQAESEDKNGKTFFYYDSKKMLVTFDSSDTKHIIVDSEGIPVTSHAQLKNLNTKDMPQQVLDYFKQKENNEIKTRELLIELNNKWKLSNLKNIFISPEERKSPKVIKNKIINHENGVTEEYDDYGVKKWLLDGKLHRIGAPAAEYPNGKNEWYLHGLLHNENGPAVNCPNGVIQWYINGQRLSKEEYEKLQLKIRLSKELPDSDSISKKPKI